MSTSARLSPKIIKETGAHYTPAALAEFLSRLTVSRIDEKRSNLRILDPACGDGELLYAVAQALPRKLRRITTLFGMESNYAALMATHDRLTSLPDPPKFEGLHINFLEWTANFSQPHIFEKTTWPKSFDAVIANPPYVRTQVMGATASKKIASQFGLTGRVDLYHAFALAMTRVLDDEGGVLGLLCSNRFLSIQSGATLREELLRAYDLHEIFDLGDTKLFEAAVLPAIVIGTKNRSGNSQNCNFTKVYEVSGSVLTATATYPDVLSAIDSGIQGKVRVGKCFFQIDRGGLSIPSDHSKPWRLSSPEQDDWLATIKSKTVFTFADLANIRVGIKTTADNVFIRSDWSSLPDDIQPEAELLRPLVSVDVAAQWWPIPPDRRYQVLYTHLIKGGRRIAIDLAQFPRAKRYLESHKTQLAGRKYVLEAGRNWYEIWVPQNPTEWEKAKVVFPDISSGPRFYIDKSGSVVNGNCYWFTTKTEDELYLLLAIANSSFILSFYDAVCGNKLYAGRRRFITQYVERFPVPDPDSKLAREVIFKARRICGLKPHTEEATSLIRETDTLVWRLFGLAEKIDG